MRFAVCVAADILAPVLSVRYHEPMAVLLSHTLPPPRTLLACLARGLGEIFGLGPEEDVKIGGFSTRARLALSWAVERSSLAFVRPRSKIAKVASMWKVWWIEKVYDVTKRGVRGLSDALKLELSITRRLTAYFFLDLEALNQLLSDIKPNLPSINRRELEKAVSCIKRVGMSECLASPKLVSFFDKRNFTIKQEGELNAYSPADWISPRANEYILEDVYVPCELVEKGLSLEMFVKKLKTLRRVTKRFVLPLREVRIERAYRVFEPIEVFAKVKPEYSIVELPDGGRCVLPKHEL